MECINYALRQVGLPEAEPRRIHSSIGLSLAEGFEFVSGLRDPDTRAEYARHFIEHADRVMADLTVVYDCVPEVLEKLRARGLRLGIVSTKFRYRIQDILAREGLTKQFDVIVGGEDTTQHKPNPQSLLLALERLACTADRAVYVGDHPVDAKAAAAAGIRFVATLTGTSQPEAFLGLDVFATLRDLSTLPETLDRAPFAR